MKNNLYDKIRIMTPYQNHSEVSQERITIRGIIVMILVDIILFILLLSIVSCLYEDTDNPSTNLRQYPLNSTSLVCDRKQTITELTRIEKKITFYDIRQHHINVDIKTDTVREFCRIKGRCSRKLVFEYWTRINNINSSIFDKKADELPIYTKDIGNENGPIDIIKYRSDNVGYIIDSEVIEKMALTDKVSFDRNIPEFLYQYEREIMEVAYYLHNTFFKKLKEEYQKIEDKYNSLPDDFNDFDKLIDEVRVNEKEMEMLEEFDSKRRKLELREMKLIFTL
jgi:hypothetical protein